MHEYSIGITVLGKITSRKCSRRYSGAIQQIADGCRRPTGPVPPSFASSPCIAALCCILRDVTGHPRPPTLAETTPSAPATLPLSPRLCPSPGEEKREQRLQSLSRRPLFSSSVYLFLHSLYFIPYFCDFTRKIAGKRLKRQRRPDQWII